jgi:hypothetical protein
MSQRDPGNDAAAEETPGDIPAGSGKQFAADVSPAAARAEGGEERTPEGSGKQFAGERRGDQPDDEEGKAFARDVSEETDEARAPDAPADSGKGFARGAPEPGPPGTP